MPVGSVAQAPLPASFQLRSAPSRQMEEGGMKGEDGLFLPHSSLPRGAGRGGSLEAGVFPLRSTQPGSSWHQAARDSGPCTPQRLP